jgi:hypothetical protein
MANPNILGSTSVIGNNSLTALSTTSATSIMSNGSGSGKIYRITSLIAANVDGTDPYNVTINHYRAAALGGTAYAIVSTLVIPADSSVIILDKNSAVYVKEDQSIGATAGTADKIVITASWEEIT